MQRPLLCAALALGCACAHGETTWTFTYTGFYLEEEQRFVPDMQLGGWFTGSDANGNGIIELPELTSLVIPNLNIPVNLLACGYEYPMDFQCTVDRFSYSEQDGLDLRSISTSSNRDNGLGQRDDVTTGELWQRTVFVSRTGYWDDRHWQWTEQTTLNVVSSVPEPGQYGMLALGLGGIAGMAWLRRRRPGPAVSA